MSFDDHTSVMPQVTIPALAVKTELTFTLTVTGRGGTTGSGIASATDTATVAAEAGTRLVKGMSITSTPRIPPVFTRGERVYGVGETIEFTVEFKDQVHVAGLPPPTARSRPARSPRR